MNAGEVCGSCPRVIARAVAERLGLMVVEAREHGKVLAEAFELLLFAADFEEVRADRAQLFGVERVGGFGLRVGKVRL